MRKRLLLLTLLISFSVPVVAHNEFNGGVGSGPNFETLQEKRLRLISKSYTKAMNDLQLEYDTLMNEYVKSPTKPIGMDLQLINRLMSNMTKRYINKKKRIEERDGKRIEERDGKKVDRKRVKNVKKKIKNAKKNKKANK